MDPTTPGAVAPGAIAPAPVSPYAASTGGSPAGSISPTQLQAIIAALQQGQGQQQQAGAPSSPGAGTGQNPSQQNQGPFSGAGNLIKGLMNPPPTSILGQASSALFGGQNAPLMSALGGPQYGGTPFGAFGGSSANPLPGLDASDYGMGF